jgi:hypothetical protein
MLAITWCSHVQLASISDFTCNFCRVCSFAVDAQESFLDLLGAKLLPVIFFVEFGRDGPLQFRVNFFVEFGRDGPLQFRVNFFCGVWPGWSNSLMKMWRRQNPYDAVAVLLSTHLYTIIKGAVHLAKP